MQPPVHSGDGTPLLLSLLLFAASCAADTACAQIDCIDGVSKIVKNATMQSEEDLKAICTQVCT